MVLDVRSTEDLRPAEIQLLRAMQWLWYGHFEGVHIEVGELILSPWPKEVQSLKFGGTRSPRPEGITEPFVLRKEHIDFFSAVRRTARAEIRLLQIQGGLPVHGQFAAEGGIAGGQP